MNLRDAGLFLVEGGSAVSQYFMSLQAYGTEGQFLHSGLIHTHVSHRGMQLHLLLSASSNEEYWPVCKPPKSKIASSGISVR